MKICLAGKNSLAVNSLEYILENKLVDKDNILLLPSSKEEPWFKNLADAAEKYKLPIVKEEELYSLKRLIFISLEYDKIIVPEKFATQKFYNIHFSLLPSYKGVYTSVIPLLNGETSSGVTLHEIDHGIDTGNIIDQIEFPIDISWSCKQFHHKHIEAGTRLFKRNINKLIQGEFISTPQPAINSSYYSKASVDYRNIKFDFKKTSFEIHNQIRAYIYKEYQLPVVKGRLIYKTVLTDQKIQANIFQDTGKCLLISGIDGYLIKCLYENE